MVINLAAVVPREVTAPLVLEEREHDAAILVALRVGRLRDVAEAAFLQARDVGRLEEDLVVATARGAGLTVPGDLARRSRMDRVALGATLRDPMTVARDERSGEPLELARAVLLPAEPGHVVERPETEVGLVALFGLREEEEGALVLLPVDGVTAGPRMRSCLLRKLALEAANDGSIDDCVLRHRATASSIRAIMRAITIKDSQLVLTSLAELERQEPGASEVRVSVRAAGVNRADVLQRMGMYPAPPDAPRDVPGLEIAGVVDSIGSVVRDVAVGDRVMAIVSGGAYADEIVLHSRLVAKVPDGIDFVQAAAIPEAFVTAYDAMVSQAGLAAGDTVLVHAVGSGVGTAAVQIARAIGATVIGTARTKDKLGRAEELGMAKGIVPGLDPSGAPKFADAVRAANGGKGVDVVLDLVGGAYLAESLHALADKGRAVLVGLMAGTHADVDLGLVLRRRLRVMGTVLRSRPLEEKIAAAQLLAHRIAPLVASGALKAIVDKTFPLEQAQAAQDYMTSNAGFGKIVLTMS